MKRTLFTLTACAACAMSLAQTPAQEPIVAQKLMKPQIELKKIQAKPEYKITKISAPKKSIENGNYFRRPAGSMYLAEFKDTWGYYYSTTLAFPAFKTIVYRNMNTDHSGEWYLINGQTGLRESASDMTDSQNNLLWMSYPQFEEGYSSIYEPALVKGSDEYRIPNNYDSKHGSNYGASSVSPSYITGLTYTDGNHVGEGPYSGFQGSDEYIWGTGNITLEDGVYKTFGVAQSFEAPISPLYVENIYMRALSNSGTPIPDGVNMTMTITDDEGNQIATLTASNSDLLTIASGIYQLTFANKQQNPITGTDRIVPFVLDKPFTVTITGFDQSGVDLGLWMFVSAADDPIDAGITLGENTETGEQTTISYRDDYGNPVYSIPMNFTGFFESIDVVTELSNSQSGETYDNSNVLRISENGTESYLENGATTSVFVNTALPWTADNGTPNYRYVVESSSTGDGSWINSPCIVDESSYDSQSSFVNYVNFTATACNANEGRWAVVKIVGKGGIQSETPIILLQGTATLDDVTTGIENAVVDNSAKKGFDENAPVYNLNGQRVSKSAKGILIQDGRKFIRK